MPDYNFENLGPKDFEELTNALGAAYIGNALRPFGVGADGGREATFRGKMSYPSAAKPWNGYLVIQCKQKQTLGATRKADADWAIAQLNADMKVYQDQTEPRPIPEYYIFVTNVVLSPKLRTGGKDRFVTKLEAWAATLGIKGVDVWDRDKLSRLLDSKQEIARRFGFLHAGDLIHKAVEQVLAQDDRLKNTIAVFLEAELRSDQYVRLTQAGHVGDDHTPLARVFVDLQALEDDDHEESDQKFYVVKTVQQVSDRPLRPSLFETERLKKAKRRSIGASNTPDWEDYSRFVFIGGPGQGKTTLAQHLAQRHRAAILSGKSFDKLERETHSILRVVRDSAVTSGIGLPTHPRIPFRIVLEQFADALAKNEVRSVIEYIAFIISKRTTINFTVNEVEKLLQEAPWFIAFDGLDEVPAASNRTEVLSAVSLFLSLARVMDADVLVVATTRPQGYEHEFAPAHFNHLKLTPLDKNEALAYAQKFVDAKYASDIERRERIMKRLQTAAEEDATARLMISPLQVTIMAALVDLVGNPPRERYPLFNRYYDIVYQREQERGLEFSDILADYRGPIDALHDHIGLVLQVEAEKAGSTQSKISKERLEGFIRAHLSEEGYEGDTLETITNSILKVALLRLVFIVPLEDARYGFEVRSLQEFAAARALMQGKYDRVKHRLKIIAPVPYWRNTMMFAVGRAFAERDEQQCDMLTQLCHELNDQETEAVISRVLAGSRLALDILEDGVVDRRPKYRHVFLEMAFDLLLFSFDDASIRIAEQYLPDNKSRYIKHIQKNIALGNKVSVSALLAYLIYQNQSNEILWAEELLKESWPTNISESCRLLEISSRSIVWNDWQIKKAIEAARVSSIEWVADTFTYANPIPVKWIRDARHLLIHQGRHADKESFFRIKLNVEGKSFAYAIPNQLPDLEILESLRDANPIHSDWIPFILSLDFISNPSIDTLAKSLDRIGTNNLYKSYHKNSNLPWVLGALLNTAKSSEDILHQARRVREGALGESQTWKDAESRWRKKGFTPADWLVFDEIEIPFSLKVAEKGIAHLPLTAMENLERCIPSIDAMMNVFRTTNSESLKNTLSEVILRCTSLLPLIGEVPAPPLSLSELSELAKQSNLAIDPSLIIDAIIKEDDFDYLEEITGLNNLGNYVDLEPYFNYSTRERIKPGENIARNLIVLISNKKPREGILRMLLSFAVLGISLPQVALDIDKLSPQGRLSYALLILLSEEPILPADLLAQYLTEAWVMKQPYEDTDVSQIIRSLDRGQCLNDYTTSVLCALLSNPIVDSRCKEEVSDTILQQNRYRTRSLVATDEHINF